MAERDRLSDTGLIHKRLDVGREERPIIPGQHYFVIRIDSYTVEEGNWFRTDFPCLHFRAVFNDGAGRSGITERVIAPEFLAAIDKQNADRIIQQRSFPLGPIPYHGSLELEFGLFAAKANSGLDSVVKMLDGLSAFAAMPYTAVAAPYANLLRDSFSMLSGGNSALRLQVGLKDAFIGECTEGTFVVARLPENRYSPDDIAFDTATQRLVVGKRRKPLRGVPYAVYSIDRVERRDDWMNIPDLKAAWEELRTLIRQDGDAAAILAGLRRFERACTTCFDLTQGHAEEITEALQARFSSLLEMRTVALPAPSGHESVAGGNAIVGLESIAGFESLGGRLAGSAIRKLFEDPGDLRTLVKGAQAAIRSARAAGEDISERVRQIGAPPPVAPPPPIEDLDIPGLSDAAGPGDIGDVIAPPSPPEPAPAPGIIETPTPFTPPPAPSAPIAMPEPEPQPARAEAKSLFERVMTFVAKWEGGKVDHPNDPGGRTNKGVTQRVFDEWRRGKGHPTQDVFEISDEEALDIYRANYWDKVRGDQLPERVALAVMDFAVNSGPARAVKYLQRLVGVAQDGAIGPTTLAAVARANPHALFETYCDARGRFYEDIIRNNRDLEVFRRGWFNRLGDLRRVGTDGGFESVFDWFAKIGLTKATDDPMASIPDLGEEERVGPLSLAEASIDRKTGEPVTPDEIESVCLPVEQREGSEDIVATLVARHAELLGVVSRLCDQAAGRTAAVSALMHKLRKTRQFDRLHVAASTFAEQGVETPFTHRMTAQALIEMGRLEEALSILRMAELAYPASNPDNLKEISELTGLEGRAFKQQFIRSGGSDYRALITAVKAYRRGWEASNGMSHWHGVNLLSLLHRSDRDGMPFERDIDRDRLALDVITAAEGDADQTWAPASAAEAALALSNSDKAKAYAQRFIESRPDDFALVSFQRQLREVWDLSKPGGDPVRQEIYDLITMALMRTDGAKLEFEPGELESLAGRVQQREARASQDPVAEVVSGGGFESLQGGFQRSIDWVQRLAKLFHCIGRMEKSGGIPTPMGTGFVMKAEMLNPAWKQYEHVLLTNEHVCSNLETPTSSALKPEQTQVRFTELDPQRAFKVGEVLWCSHSSKHDVCILALPSFPEGLRTLDDVCRPAPQGLEAVPPGQRQQKVTVIGYPQGSDRPKLGIENLEMLPLSKKRGAVPPATPADPEYLLYTSPTEPGNSGSPVFTWDTLETAAIHHWGKDSVGFNQGISLRSIIDAIAADPKVNGRGA